METDLICRIGWKEAYLLWRSMMNPEQNKVVWSVLEGFGPFEALGPPCGAV